MLAVALHLLFFSMEAPWLKKSISHPLQRRPLALALSYRQPEQKLSLPTQSPENIQKVSPPLPKEEKKSPSKPEPPKKISKPKKPEMPKPPKKAKPLSIAKRPEPSKVEEKPEPIPDFEASEIDHMAFDLPSEPVEEPVLEAALPSQENMYPETSVLSVREAIPIYRKNPPPHYPRIARRRGYEGTVVLELLVSPEGKVHECRLYQSCGYSVLDEAAMKSVRDWVFDPAMRGDKRVEMWVKVPITFQLK